MRIAIVVVGDLYQIDARCGCCRGDNILPRMDDAALLCFSICRDHGVVGPVDCFGQKDMDIFGRCFCEYADRAVDTDGRVCRFCVVLDYRIDEQGCVHRCNGMGCRFNPFSLIVDPCRIFARRSFRQVESGEGGIAFAIGQIDFISDEECAGNANRFGEGNERFLCTVQRFYRVNENALLVQGCKGRDERLGMQQCFRFAGTGVDSYLNIYVFVPAYRRCNNVSTVDLGFTCDLIDFGKLGHT